jgi:hypothetical protein
VKYNLPNTSKAVGFEYQLLDDQKHSDGAKPSHQTAALYDLIPSIPGRVVMPVGEWNQSRLLVDGNHVEQWLNGVKTVEFEIGSPELTREGCCQQIREIKGFWPKNLLSHFASGPRGPGCLPELEAPRTPSEIIASE